VSVESVTFIRTPSLAKPERNEDWAYIAHSVMSVRHAPNGMTFDEIREDHLRQAQVDEVEPFDEETAALHLIRCLEAGLVSTLETHCNERTGGQEFPG